MRAAFGVDVGGTATKIGLVDEGGALRARWEIPTDTANKGAGILQNAARVVREETRRWDSLDISGAGLAVPGPVRPDGVVTRCLNLGWGETHAREDFEALTGLPCTVGNDGSMAALGEVWRGAARGAQTFVMLTLGTGVGGGIVVHGKPLSGNAGSAGEVGHILVNPDETKPCTCGNTGCLEQYGSARALELSAARYLEQNPDTKTALRGRSLTARDVMEAAKAGDAAATLLVDALCDALGRGTGVLGTILNPDLFIIGGGLAQAGEFLLRKIQAAHRKYAFRDARPCPFALAALGNDAAVYGCAKSILFP